jgi:hypothetical protein
MKTRAGFIQGYNAQVVVTEDQIILATEVTVEENDVHQLHPMLEKTRENLQAIGVEDKIKAVLGDAGYWSEANSKAEPEGPELFISTTKDHKQRKAMKEKPSPRGRIPKDLSSRDRMERKLLTKRGRAFTRSEARPSNLYLDKLKKDSGSGGSCKEVGMHATVNGTWPVLPTTF